MVDSESNVSVSLEWNMNHVKNEPFVVNAKCEISELYLVKIIGDVFRWKWEIFFCDFIYVLRYLTVKKIPFLKEIPLSRIVTVVPIYQLSISFEFEGAHYLKWTKMEVARWQVRWKNSSVASRQTDKLDFVARCILGIFIMAHVCAHLQSKHDLECIKFRKFSTN